MNQLQLEKVSAEFAEFAKKNKVVLSTAESCTAGLISATVAMTSGSSAWLDCGYVVYTPAAKNQILGVSFDTIKKYDITSEQVALEMAYGAFKKSDADISIAVTGVAGPGGGTDEIPVGTVCMAWAILNGSELMKFSETKIFSGSRNEVREQVVQHTLKKAIELYNKNVLYDF